MFGLYLTTLNERLAPVLPPCATFEGWDTGWWDGAEQSF